MVQDLIKYNARGILSSLLSIEEHLSELGDRLAPHSWCAKKHSLIAIDHHGKEIINHLSKVNEAKAEQIRGFIEKMDKTLENNISLHNVRDLRNEWRELIKDDFPDLAKLEGSSKECGVCSKDILEAIERLKNSSKYNDNRKINSKTNGERKMLTPRDIGIITGSQFVGRGISASVLPYIDILMKADGKANFEKPSTWLGIIGGIAGIYASTKIKDEYALPVAVISSNILANTVIRLICPTASLQINKQVNQKNILETVTESSQMVEEEARKKLISVD
jgi:hypothetical protein